MIYDRFGAPITLERYANADDVKRLEQRKKLDKHDQKALESRAYLVAALQDGTEELVHIAYVRADDGLREIVRAIEVFDKDTYKALDKL